MNKKELNAVLKILFTVICLIGTYRCNAFSFLFSHDLPNKDIVQNTRNVPSFATISQIRMSNLKIWKSANYKVKDVEFIKPQHKRGFFNINYEGDDSLHLNKFIVHKINNEEKQKMKSMPNVIHGNAGHPIAVIDEMEMKQYINSFCVTRKGTWIVSVTSGEIGKAKVYVKRSEDKGKTWSKDRILVYNPDIDRRLENREDYDCEMGQLFPVPNPIDDKETYRIYQFSIVRNIKEGWRFGKLIYTYSEDDGKTWIGPHGLNSFYDLESPVYDIVGHNWGWHLMAPPRLMSNGMVYLPMNASTDPKKLADIRCEPVFARSRNILTEIDPSKISFDFKPAPPHGIFVPMKGKPGESHGMEAQIVELSDHRLFSVMRTGNGCVYFTTSEDFGETWNEAKPLRRDDGEDPVLNPNCPCPLTKLIDGRYALLHCNNDGRVGGASNVFAAGSVRNPIYVSIGVENGSDKEQPIRWSKPRLMTTLEEYKEKFGSKGRDLTYGCLHEEDGNYYHFYNAMWERIQVNKVSPMLFQ
jgi:hypothetical protein